MVVILLLIFQYYLITYSIIINIYFIIKNFKIIKFNIFYDKYNLFLNKIFIFFRDIKLDFTQTNIALLKVKKKHNNFFIIIYFFYDCIKSTLILVFSLLFNFTLFPVLSFLNFLFRSLLKISKADESHVNYGITKLTFGLTLTIVYILLQTTEIFQDCIISIYEFFSTAIIIPLILESLLNIRKSKN